MVAGERIRWAFRRTIRAVGLPSSLTFLLYLVLNCATPKVHAQQDAIPGQTSSDALPDLAGQVAKIVAQQCFDCHGGDERNGGLAFDDSATFFREADSGETPVLREDASLSGILLRIRSTDPNTQMPPEGDRLSKLQVEAFERWINSGAPSLAMEASGSSDDTDEKLHWSFRPLAITPPPEVELAEWSRNPIDRFVEARRTEAGLTSVGSADPATLLRRVAFGLTGLPPTYDEVVRFEQAVASEGKEVAMAAAIDDYLSRHSYGQRWGRHWMDWVRYADTAGDNSDFPIPQAYLYRNYIIDAFNADMPYDHFLREQLAGDLMPSESEADRQQKIIATGYLGMARRFGSLVERYPWHLTIEDTIDNVGRTMMGLTLACARCHDHKFDPISTRDYYSLYGIFESTRYPFPGIELFQTQHDLVPLLPEDEARALLEPYAEKTLALEKKLDEMLTRSQQRARDNAAREATATLAEKRRDRDELDSLLIKARKAGEALADHLKSIPDYPAAYAVQDAEPVDASVQIKGEPTRPGATVPRGFPVVLGGQRLSQDVAKRSSGRLELANWITSPENPLTARVIVNRVWQRHFGRGIVASTSDFGLRGELPSHPELLDWLAAEFVRSGWSIKELHRIILTSRTYQQSSFATPENAEIDPENRYLWKNNRQRLDAESIRDTLLLLAGNLDTTPQNSPFPFPEKSKWKYTQHHPFKDDYASNKRSVYLMTKRLTAKTYFQTFDGPDRNVCTSDRDESVTPLQALYFVNDDFFHEQASRIADRTRPSNASDIKAIEEAYRLVLSRNPSAAEADLILQHLDLANQRTADRPQAWASTIRSLLRQNEFLYVD